MKEIRPNLYYSYSLRFVVFETLLLEMEMTD